MGKRKELPPIGTIIIGKYHGEKYTAHIVAEPKFPEGKAIKLGKQIFKTMTSASNSITNCSTNGWKFWKF